MKSVLKRAAGIAALCLAAAALSPPAGGATAECRPAQSSGWSVERAVSMRGWIEALNRCRGKPCPREVAQLFGLGRIDGYVLAPADGDVILVGPAHRGGPQLRSDDLLVALRSATGRYAEREGNTRILTPLGVTIDARPENNAAMNRIAATLGRAGTSPEAFVAQWCATCEVPQDVVLLGLRSRTTGLDDSRSTFASVLVRADYALKSMADRPEAFPVEGLENLRARRRAAALEQLRRDPRKAAFRTHNRFWFRAGVARYLDSRAGVLFDRVDIQLRQEKQQVDRQGRIRDAGRPDPVADGFACDVSRRFPELAAVLPVYRELADLYRMVAVAQVLASRSDIDRLGTPFDAALDRHPLTAVDVPETVPGIAHAETIEHRTNKAVYTFAYPTCGGVEVFYDGDRLSGARDESDQVARILARVLASRPAGAPAWDVR